VTERSTERQEYSLPRGVARFDHRWRKSEEGGKLAKRWRRKWRGGRSGCGTQALLGDRAEVVRVTVVGSSWHVMRCQTRLLHVGDFESSETWCRFQNEKP